MIRLLLLGLVLTSPALAQTYDFAAAPAGCAACGGDEGSFDYTSGAITHFAWNGYSWATQSGTGNSLAFINPLGDVLNTTLLSPLGGQSATASDFIIHYALGGQYDYCQGDGLCDQGPLVFTATNQVGSQALTAQAPEIGVKGAPVALILLLGSSLAVIRGMPKRL